METHRPWVSATPGVDDRTRVQGVDNALAAGQAPILSTVKPHLFVRVERQPDGTWRTYRPDGTEIVIRTPLLAVR